MLLKARFTLYLAFGLSAIVSTLPQYVEADPAVFNGRRGYGKLQAKDAYSIEARSIVMTKWKASESEAKNAAWKAFYRIAPFDTNLPAKAATYAKDGYNFLQPKLSTQTNLIVACLVIPTSEAKGFYISSQAPGWPFIPATTDAIAWKAAPNRRRIWHAEDLYAISYETALTTKLVASAHYLPNSFIAAYRRFGTTITATNPQPRNPCSDPQNLDPTCNVILGRLGVAH
jgi:hypothetical protein